MLNHRLNKPFAGFCACALCTAIFFTACQPTPDVAPVVNKRESAEALAQSANSAAPVAESAIAAVSAPTEYKAAERWTEEIVKDDKFKVQADVDVMMPQLEKLPVQKVTRKVFTQDDLDGFLTYFTGGQDVQFYKWPLPKSKAELEEELLQFKKNLAEAEASGENEWAGQSKLYIKETEAKIKTAPEKPEITYMEPKFTYMLDYETGKPYKKMGENFAALTYDDPQTGESCTVYVTKYSEGQTDSDSLSYYRKEFKREYVFIENLATIEQQLAYENSDPSVTRDLMDSKKVAEDSLALIKKSLINEDKANAEATKILKELGIADIQIISCQPALLAEKATDYFEPYTQQGIALDFARSAAGLPTAGESKNNIWYAESEGDYAPPFHEEYGCVVLDENYELAALQWLYPSKFISTVMENSELLPFEQLTKRAVDRLYFAHTGHYTEEFPYDETAPVLRFEVADVRLMAAYTAVPNDLDSALIVPAYRFTFDLYFINRYDPDSLELPDLDSTEELHSGLEEIWVNALDGSIITRPVSPYTPEDMFDLEYEPGETPEPTPAPGNE